MEKSIVQGKITSSMITISSQTDENNKLIKISINGETVDTNNIRNNFLKKLQYFVCECLNDRDYKLMNEINEKLSELRN